MFFKNVPFCISHCKLMLNEFNAWFNLTSTAISEDSSIAKRRVKGLKSISINAISVDLTTSASLAKLTVDAVILCSVKWSWQIIVQNYVLNK